MSLFAPGVGEGVGLAVGEAVGVAVAVGVGVAPGGVGVVNAFPSKLPGFVGSGAAGREVVALDPKIIHLPSLLICGREFVISTRIFACDSAVCESS